MFKTIVILCIVAIICYGLYLCGLLTVQSKRAIVFIGYIRRDGSSKASFTSCSGFLKRVLRVKEDKIYDFVLKDELSDGVLSVELLNSKKELLMKLDRENKTARILIKSKTRYYLVVKFKSATGSYELEPRVWLEG